jgi:hypothetical protein
VAVAYDAQSESHSGTTGATNVTSFNFTHTPVGTPRGVLIFVYHASDGAANVETVTSVTYGGVAVPAVSGGAAADTITEPGRCTAYFLGSGIPTGAQSVVVNRTNSNTTVTLYAISITVTANADTRIPAGSIVIEQENLTPVERNIDDGSPGSNSVRFAGAYYGGTTLTVGANSTSVNQILLASAVCRAARETTAGQGSRPIGFAPVADDWAAVYVAVSEVLKHGALLGGVRNALIYEAE